MPPELFVDILLMKFVFLLFVVSSLLCFPVQAKEIFITASAKIYSDEIVDAKERVLKNAQLKAVKKGVEIFLVKKTINHNYQVIREQIYNFNQKFIRNYEIVNQDIDLDQRYVEVQIKANVAEVKIQQKLKQLGILHDRMGYKSLMLVYQGRTTRAMPRNNGTVQDTIQVLQENFANHGFSTFDQQTMRQIYRLLDQDKSDLLPVDILIALALNYNAEILVIMEIIPGKRDNLKGSFYQVKSNVRFSVFNTADGQQIAETVVEGIERSVNNPDENQWQSLLQRAGTHAVLENVRQSIEQITLFYQRTGDMVQVYTIVFSGYSPRRESLIINYLENTAEYRQLAELKNTFGHLELELLTLKRKSTLRRRITSDLLKQEIEVATKTLPGNHLFFINPNPMEEIELPSENESETSDDPAAEASPSQ
ncbi:MAG: hypothetical protein NZ878_05405 [SAR324 cluster bacterium]|nr:hypothetical protein [SAR324 cluster bacterium]